jgi:hypothetical protein
MLIQYMASVVVFELHRTYSCSLSGCIGHGFPLVSAIKNYIADPRGRLNEQLKKDMVLLPTSSTRSAASHELRVLRHQIEEDIINGNVDTNRMKLWHRPNGEGRRRHL